MGKNPSRSWHTEKTTQNQKQPYTRLESQGLSFLQGRGAFVARLSTLGLVVNYGLWCLLPVYPIFPLKHTLVYPQDMPRIRVRKVPLGRLTGVVGHPPTNPPNLSGCGEDPIFSILITRGCGDGTCRIFNQRQWKHANGLVTPFCRKISHWGSARLCVGEVGKEATETPQT